MIQTGIWIDGKSAKIVKRINGREQLYEIKSGIENYQVRGGSGTVQKGGPQDVVQDSKYRERYKHQLYHFFDLVSQHVEESDSIIIFGPAQTGLQLKKRLLEKCPAIHSQVIAVKKAERMSDNQLVAWVNDYFASPRYNKVQ